MTSRWNRLVVAVLSVAAVGAVSAVPALASGSTTRTATQSGMTVTLTATPAKAKVGQPVRFLARAQTEQAPGAWISGMAYGDGTRTRPMPIPQYCMAGGGRPASGKWSYSHTYTSPGRYQATFHAAVNCSGESASVQVVVSVS